MSSAALVSVTRYRDRHLHGDVPDYEHLLELGYTRVIGHGATVLDVGAHAGRHTDRFIQLVGLFGRVVAFEPIPGKAEGLRRRYRWRLNVSVREMALAAKAGTANFLHVENYPEESGLKRRIYNQGDAHPVEISVRVSTLDIETAVLRRVDFIKLDIEGAELTALDGARQVLARFRPIVSVEYGHPAYSAYGHTADSLWDFAASVGYRLSDLFGNLVDTAEDWRQICDVAYWDYFLVPVEKVEGWATRMAGRS
jgi:FkbM family methyltransferase